MELKSLTKKDKASLASGNAVVIYADNYINDIEGEKLEDRCGEFLRNGINKVVIDFSCTDIINSIGVSILIGIIEKFKEKKGIVLFSGLKKVNYDIFAMVGLTKHVPVFNTEEEALELLREREGSLMM